MKKTCLLLILSAIICQGPIGAQQSTGNDSNPAGQRAETEPVFLYKVIPVNITGEANNRVNVAYAGEGYTKSDLSAFPQHVRTAVDYLNNDIMYTRPYPRYFNFLNIYRIELESEESGISQAPSFGKPMTSEVKNSIGGAKDEDRLGWVDGKLAEALFVEAAGATGLDRFDWKYAILNNPGYHNSGGRHVVFSYNYGKEIALHEAGHGLHQLADEYYGKGVYTRREPREVNVTADSTGAKWSHWIGYVDKDTVLGTVGVYEGAIYADKGAYRPTPNSKMGWTSDRRPASFNAICREKIILDIYDIVRPVESSSDTANIQTNPEKLWVKVIDPAVIIIDWYVDGKLVAANGGESLPGSAIGPKKGTYSVRAHVYDEVVKHAFSDNANPHPLDLVRRDLHKLQQNINWKVEITKQRKK
jgi:hypothetical protein